LGHGAVGLGYFYDARNDNFLGFSIFKKFLPDELILLTDTVHTNYKFSLSDTWEEKLSTLNIEASLKLSVMGGLVDLSGAGKYLNDPKKSKKIVRGALLCEVRTKEETFSISNDEIKNYFIGASTIKNVNATHIVTGVKWGANVIASFEIEKDEAKEASEIEAKFGEVLKTLKYSLQGNENDPIGKFKLNQQQDVILSKSKIEFFGDIIMTDADSPQTYDDALQLMKRIPYFIKQTNNGKGVQLQYTMLSIKELNNLLGLEFRICRLIEDTSEGTITKAERLFDNLNSYAQDLNDLKDKISKNSDTIPDNLENSIVNKLSVLSENEASIRSEFSKILVDVRSGNKEPNEMDTFFSKNNMIEFLTNMHSFINEKSILLRKYLYLKEVYEAKNIKLLEKSKSISVLRINRDDMYLLYCSFETFCSSENQKFSQFISLAQNNTNSIFKIVF
jgi:hypothetical protein